MLPKCDLNGHNEVVNQFLGINSPDEGDKEKVCGVLALYLEILQPSYGLIFPGCYQGAFLIVLLCEMGTGCNCLMVVVKTVM